MPVRLPPIPHFSVLIHQGLDVVDDVLSLPIFLVKGNRGVGKRQGLKGVSNIVLEAGGDAYV